MSNYQYGLNPSTSSSAIIFVASGVMLCGAFMQVPADAAQPWEDPLSSINTESYSREMADSTASPAGITIEPTAGKSDPEFKFGAADFYDQLLDQQEWLGASFSNVLEDNLWDLYVRA